MVYTMQSDQSTDRLSVLVKPVCYFCLEKLQINGMFLMLYAEYHINL